MVGEKSFNGAPRIQSGTEEYLDPLVEQTWSEREKTALLRAVEASLNRTTDY